MDNKGTYRDRSIKNLMRLTRKRSLIKGFELNIDEKVLRKLWDDNSGRCVISGIEFCDELVMGQNRRPYAASVDRISSKKGYIKSNVRLVCQCVNIGLFIWGDSVFNNMIKSVYERTVMGEIKISENNQPFLKEELLCRGHCELVAKLPSGWFSKRIKNNQSTPDAENVTVWPGGLKRYKYNIKNLLLWLQLNPEAAMWTPPGYKLQISSLQKPYYVKI